MSAETAADQPIEQPAAPTSQPAPPDAAEETFRATVVILSYHSEQFLEGCLEALGRSRGVELEIVCVDNASPDRSHEIAQKHPLVAKAIRSEQNLGFSGGNNLGWREGTAPYVVLINPDCRVQPDALRNLLAPLRDEPEVAIVGARLLYPNTNTLQHAGGILHPNGMCEHFGVDRPDGAPWDKDRDVEYVTGALIAFRRGDLEDLGGLDEDYWPAYYEETDLCYRVRRQGRKVRYAAGAVAYHYESPALEKRSARLVRTSYRSRIRFIVKNYGVVEFCRDFLPFEVRWFFGRFARGYRWQTVRSYLSGVLFALRCVARLSRRPRQPPREKLRR